MQKLWLILICVIGVTLSCSDVVTDDDPHSDRDGFNDDTEEDEDFSRKRDTLGNKSACKGDGYTLYLDDCPEEEEREGERDDSTYDDPSVISPYGFSGGDMRATSQPVDILFVLDTSYSMNWLYNPSQFKKKFGLHFLSHLRGVDWRMMFTTADYPNRTGFYIQKKEIGQAIPIEGKRGLLRKKGTSREYIRYLDSSYRNKESFFYTMTTEPNQAHAGPGKEGYGDKYVYHFPPYLGGTEYPLRALQNSFSVNKSLTREDGILVAIIVSNTDENTHKKSPDPTAQSIMKHFQDTYNEGKKLYILNLIILPGDQKCLAENNSHQFWFPESNSGQKIAKVAKEVGGGNFSICLSDYSEVAKTIARLSK